MTKTQTKAQLKREIMSRIAGELADALTQANGPISTVVNEYLFRSVDTDGEMAEIVQSAVDAMIGKLEHIEAKLSNSENLVAAVRRKQAA